MNKTKKLYLCGTLIVVSLFLGWIIILSVYLKVPVLSLLFELSGSFYEPHFNIVTFKALANINVLNYFYILLLIGTLIFVGIQHSIRPDLLISLRQSLLIIAVCLYFSLTGWQTISLMRDFLGQKSFFQGKSLEEKYTSVYGDTYIFAKNAKELVPGAHSAVFVTDLDYTKNPGQFTHRVLAYFIYPLEIRDFHFYQEDCLIIFEKKDAMEYVPDDYRIIKKFNNRSLIAVKKDKY